MKLPLPHWLCKVPFGQRADARRRFLLRAAALYASESGHTTALSTQLGMASRAMGQWAALGSKKKISRRIAEGVEQATGGVVTAADLTDERT
jgi:hypothetical protein